MAWDDVHDPCVSGSEAPCNDSGHDPHAAIGLAKAASATTDLGDGTFSVNLSFELQNPGSVDLSNVSIIDPLARRIAPATIVSINRRASAGLEFNPAYDGQTDSELLQSGQVLRANSRAELGFELVFDPNGDPGPFFNRAKASGEARETCRDPRRTHSSDMPATCVKTVVDLSQNGVDPDPDTVGLTPEENPNPGDNSDPTPIEIPELLPPPKPIPVIGLAKAAGTVVPDTDGRFSVPVRLIVQNAGNVDLTGVQIIDSLAAEIAPATVYDIRGIASDGLEHDASFDGRSNVSLLLPGQTLAADSQAEVTFVLVFDPNGNPGPFLNRAKAMGRFVTECQSTHWSDKPEGCQKSISDRSQNGLDPDPDTPGNTPADNPNPGDNHDPTPIELPPPVIGLAKWAPPTATFLGGSEYETRLRFVLQNNGPIDLTNVQITDAFETAIAPAQLLSVAVIEGDMEPNPGFNGRDVTEMLAPAQSLRVGAEATFEVELTFDAGEHPGPFFNTATATADADFSCEATPKIAWDDNHETPCVVPTARDISQNGLDTDPSTPGLAPEDNPDPSKHSDPTPIPIDPPPPATIGLAKAAGVSTRLANGAYTVPLTFVVQNVGEQTLDEVRIEDALVDAIRPANVHRRLGYDRHGRLQLERRVRWSCRTPVSWCRPHRSSRAMRPPSH